MKERTLDAIAKAEEYFCSVIEEEAGNSVVPSRTEEIHWAVEGLEGIAFIKYKQMLKAHMIAKHTSVHDSGVTMGAAIAGKHQ